MTNPVKRMLKEGKCALGSWLTVGHPAVAEVMAQAGFDWLALDAEHGANEISDAATLFAAASGTPCVPLVRVPANDLIWIRRSLDSGAMGVIVPMVNTPEQAARAVAVAKYPPEGERGIGICRANKFGLAFDEYLAEANREVLVIAQIEHVEGLRNVEAIARTPGIDGLFIGPYDLSGSMGILGQFDHPDLVAALERIRAAAVAAGVAPGLHIVTPDAEQIRRRIDEGFRFIACGVDFLMLRAACGDVVRQFRRSAAIRGS